jgi:bacteriocin-like protein
MKRVRSETIQVLTHNKLAAVIGGLPTSNSTSALCDSLDSHCTC